MRPFAGEGWFKATASSGNGTGCADASRAVWVAEILRQSGWFVVLPPEPGAAGLFVKSTDERGAPRVFVKTLTAEELRQFEQQGLLLNTAAQVLDFLRTLRSLPEAGNM